MSSIDLQLSATPDAIGVFKNNSATKHSYINFDDCDLYAIRVDFPQIITKANDKQCLSWVVLDHQQCLLGFDEEDDWKKQINRI